jgi:hypothetical protein
MTAGAGGRDLKEEFGGDVEAAAEAPNVVLVEFALAAEDFGDEGDAKLLHGALSELRIASEPHAD